MATAVQTDFANRRIRFDCPRCGMPAESAYGEDSAEVPCQRCECMIQLPSFVQEPAEVLSRLEDEFLGRSEDPMLSNDRAERMGLVIALAGGLAGMLGVAVYDGGFSSKAFFAGFVGTFLALVAVGTLCAGLWHKVQQARIASLHVKAARRRLGLGETLEGTVTLRGRKPIELCSVGVGLALQAGQRVNSGGESSSYRWHYLCRSSVLLSSRFSLEAGARRQFDVRLATPQTGPASRNSETSEWSIAYDGSGQFLSKTKQMDRQTLLKKRRLRWLITTEVIGPDGILLQSQKTLKVTGGRWLDPIFY